MPFDNLRMRAEGDKRPVIQVKTEWFQYGVPDLIFDDYTKAINHYRYMGITAVQVRERNEDGFSQ